MLLNVLPTIHFSRHQQTSGLTENWPFPVNSFSKIYPFWYSDSSLMAKTYLRRVTFQNSAFAVYSVVDPLYKVSKIASFKLVMCLMSK